MSQLKDDLIAAKALIDTPEKWRKDGCFGYHTDRLCALGACNTVASEHLSSPSALQRALVEALPSHRCFVTAFNDDVNTTHADIMALFDRAIAAAP